MVETMQAHGQQFGCLEMEMVPDGLLMGRLTLWRWWMEILNALCQHTPVVIMEEILSIPQQILSSKHQYSWLLPLCLFLRMNADLVNNELISGFEWNVHDSQIDMTWWMTWFDLGSQSWTSQHSTLVVQSGHGQDYHEFYDSFMGEGFSLLINLAEGGDMPGTNSVFQNGQPQYIVVKSAKAYGF